MNVIVSLKSLPSVTLPFASRVVKAAVPQEAAPMFVPSIAPPLISTVFEVNVEPFLTVTTPIVTGKHYTW